MIVRDHRSGWQDRAGQGSGRREKRAIWCDECVCAALTATLCGTHALCVCTLLTNPTVTVTNTALHRLNYKR
jgi:hypothetical protein